MLFRALCLLLALAGSALGTTYYVDPATGSNANNGTSSATPWLTPPGTMNAGATAYSSTAWGAITAANKIQCGDTILLKGGSTQTSAQGGSWCLATGGGCAAARSYYTATCTAASPISILVATSGQWAGSSGPFTINGSGVTPANSASYNYAGIILISKVSGITVGGTSSSQRLVITGPITGSSGNNCIDVEIDGSPGGSQKAGFTVQWMDISGGLAGGIAMGEITDSVIHDVITHDNGGPGIDCGEQLHHQCLRVGWVNVEAYHNTGGVFYCDAFYIQGPQQLYVIGAYSHDNDCNGLNAGAGDHTYPYPSRTLVRDSTFSHNGDARTTIGSSGDNFEGSGDTYPSQVGAPSHGYCSGGSDDGTVCTPGTCTIGCSIYDAYTSYDHVITFGAHGPGSYAHHGSGFTWWNHLTSFNNNLDGTFGDTLESDHVAGDHLVMNSIIVGQRGQSMLSYNTNGLHKVCRQNCANPGIPCAVEGDCGACADGTIAACNQYRPMMGAKYNLFHPSFGDSNAAAISNFGFICDATCTGGTAGQQCAQDSDCAGCSGGCVWAGGGGTFATPPAFLNDVTNKIGTAYNPNFTDISATNCQNGTDVTACDFSLAAGSAAIDAGSWPMLTNGAGTRSNTLVVKHNVPEPLGTIQFNGLNDDAGTWFIPQNGYLGYGGDTIEIQGATCNPAGDPTVLAISGSTITLDRTCTWSADMGVDRPWQGLAPDMGALESGITGSTTTTTATTTTTTTASTTTTTTATTTTTTTATTTTTTTSTTTTTGARSTTTTTVVTTTTGAVTTTQSTATTTTTRAATTTTTITTVPPTPLDLGLDPSMFTTQYQVSNEVAPVYQVQPTASGSAPFNDATTPQLMPCGLQNLDVQVMVSSAEGSPPVYPQVAVRLYTNAGAPITSYTSSTTVSAVFAELSPLAPGASSTAQVTAISSLGPNGELVFKPGDLPRNRAIRMEITVTPYADAQFSQPATDTNPGNDVINFWLMRAC